MSNATNHKTKKVSHKASRLSKFKIYYEAL